MIQPTSHQFGFNRTDALTTAATKFSAAEESATPSTDRLSRSNSEALRAALSNDAEIRPEVLARGRQLAVDGNYPPREIIASLAKMFTESRDLAE